MFERCKFQAHGCRSLANATTICQMRTNPSVFFRFLKNMNKGICDSRASCDGDAEAEQLSTGDILHPAPSST